MPFAKERYPKDWKQIRTAIVERDGHRCKFCGLEHGAIGFWEKDGPWHYSEEYLAVKTKGFGIYTTLGWTKMVLTVAHLDHDTTNNDPSNLAALCQRCHLRYDAKHHAQNALATRRKKIGQLSMEMASTSPAPSSTRRPIHTETFRAEFGDSLEEEG